MLGLPCCTQAFSSCREWRLLFVVVCGPLTAVASLVVALGMWASAVAVARCSSTGQLLLTGLVACSMWGWIHVSCVGRWILCHWATREAPGIHFFFTKHDAAEVLQVFAWIDESCAHIYCWIVFSCIAVPEFNHSPPTEWLSNHLATLSCFQLWGIVNQVAVKVYVQVFMWMLSFHFSGTNTPD